MKKLTRVVILFCVICLGCEEVINLPLDESTPRLVISGSVEYTKTYALSNVALEVSKTSSYYNNRRSIVENAKVSIEYESKTYGLTFDPQLSNFIGSIPPLKPGTPISLKVLYDGSTYTAETIIEDEVEITGVTQEVSDNIIGGKTHLVKIRVKNRKDVKDFILKKITIREDNDFLIKEIEDDVFYKDSDEIETLSRFPEQTDLVKGDNHLEIVMSRVNANYYEYNKIITSLASARGGRPFQTAKATIRGNIINETNPDNFALGYFHSNIFIKYDKPVVLKSTTVSN